MSITAHSRFGGETGTMGRLLMLAPPLAALLYLSFPKIPSGLDSHRKAKSSHP